MGGVLAGLAKLAPVPEKARLNPTKNKNLPGGFLQSQLDSSWNFLPRLTGACLRLQSMSIQKIPQFTLHNHVE